MKSLKLHSVAVMPNKNQKHSRVAVLAYSQEEAVIKVLDKGYDIDSKELDFDKLMELLK